MSTLPINLDFLRGASPLALGPASTTAATSAPAPAGTRIIDNQALGLTAFGVALGVAAFLVDKRYRLPLLLASAGVGIYGVVRALKSAEETVRRPVERAAELADKAAELAADVADDIVGTLTGGFGTPVGPVAGTDLSEIPEPTGTSIPAPLPVNAAKSIIASWVSPVDRGELNVGGLQRTFQARIKLTNKADAILDAPIRYELFFNGGNVHRGLLFAPFLPFARRESYTRTFSLPLPYIPGNVRVLARLLIDNVELTGGRAEFDLV